MSVMSQSSIAKVKGGDLVLVTGPACEPVTTAEVKDHLNIKHSAHDALLDRFTTTARITIETIVTKCMIQQTWQFTADQVTSPLELWMLPLVSVVKVEYIVGWDEDTLVLFDSTYYGVTGRYVFARASWPTHRGFQSFRVTWKAGFNGLESVSFLRSDDSLTSIAVATNVGTATTVAAHKVSVDDLITVQGATVDTDLNNSYTVASVLTPTTFTFPTVDVADATYTESTLRVDGDAPGAVQKATAQAAVPGGLKTAVMNMIGYLYENREGQAAEIKYETIADKFGALPPGVKEGLMPWIDWSLT